MLVDILFGLHNLFISMKRPWKNNGKVNTKYLDHVSSFKNEIKRRNHPTVGNSPIVGRHTP